MNKLMKEYLEFIGETPIEDISHIGDHNTATNFTKPEIKMLKSEKYEKRLRNAFSKTPFVFDIVFLYHDEFNANSLRDNEFIRDYIPNKKIDDEYDGIKGKPGIITFVAQGNLSPNDRIPMTPWILAHKIGHSLEDDQLIKNFILNDEIKHILMDHNKNNDLMSHENKIFNELFSFKAWKNFNFGGLIRNREIYPELISLYLITGKIVPNKTNDEELNEKMKKYCLKLTNILENVFKSLEGKVLTEV